MALLGDGLTAGKSPGDLREHPQRGGALARSVLDQGERDGGGGRHRWYTKV